jgi:mRNA interferase MazF
VNARLVYTPDRGDILFTNFSPQAGHEMRGEHPCIVLSESQFSVATGLMVVCPITSKVKGSPFEVILPPHLRTKGCVVASEVRTQDYFARGVRFVEKTPQLFLHQVQAIACAVLGCP